MLEYIIQCLFLIINCIDCIASNNFFDWKIRKEGVIFFNDHRSTNMLDKVSPGKVLRRLPTCIQT